MPSVDFKFKTHLVRQLSHFTEENTEVKLGVGRDTLSKIC